jgi:hypothetical protein
VGVPIDPTTGRSHKKSPSTNPEIIANTTINFTPATSLLFAIVGELPYQCCNQAEGFAIEARPRFS